MRRAVRRWRRACAAGLLGGLLCIGTAMAALPGAVRFSTADGLPSNTVHQAVEDRQGYLWFATDDGLARFDGRRFRVWRIEQGLADNRLLALAVDGADQLWLGSRGGHLMRMSADRRRIDPVLGPRNPAMAGAAVSVVLPDAAGSVWFGTRGAGLFRLAASGRLHHYLPGAAGDGLPDREVAHLALAADGALWVGTPRGLARWREGRFQATPQPALADTAITALAADDSGRLWVGSTAGLWRAARDGVLQPVAAAPGTHLLGAGLAVAGHGGAPWLAQGASVWQHAEGSAAAALTLTGFDPSAQPPFERAFASRRGELWLLGTPLGMWRLPPYWPHFSAVSQPPPRVAAIGAVALDAQVRVLACAPGQVWRFGAGAVEWRGAAGAARRRWPLAAVGLDAANGPVALHCDGDTGLWLGDRDGLKRWSGERFDTVAGAPAQISALHVDREGAVWMASIGAVVRGEWHQGQLQVGEAIGSGQGLPLLRLPALASDADGALWATSARGLLRLRPGPVQVFTHGDGVPDQLQGAQLQAAGQRMLAIAGPGTALQFDPRGLAASLPPPLLVVERVQLRRGGRLLTLPAAAPLRLHADDRDIQISVRLLGAPPEARGDYRFRLRGQDAQWVRVGRRGTRGFAQLPAGTHQLDIQARAADGRWSVVQSLQLQVLRSGWQHPLVGALRAGLGIALLLAVFWAVWRRSLRAQQWRSAAQRQALALHSAQAKARYLATFGHELRTPLTGLLGMGEILLGAVLDPAQRRPLERIQQGGKQLLQVIDQALDDARLDAGRVPLQPRVFAVAQVLRQWQLGLLLPLCARGTALALCVHLPRDAGAHGDPQRLAQLLSAVVEALASRTAAARITLRVWWQPGREGLLLDIAASGAREVLPGRLPPLLPAPSLAAMRQSLARASRLSEAMAGSLRLHIGPGRSWQVLLGLPMPAQPPYAIAAAAAPIPGVPARAARVLLVQDDPQQAAHACAALRRYGHPVLHVPHALAALAELAATPVDVVLLDLQLRGIDGWALLAMLRAQGHRLPVLLLAVGTAPDTAARAQAAGACGLLQLPASGQALHAEVLRACAGQVDRRCAANRLPCGSGPGSSG